MAIVALGPGGEARAEGEDQTMSIAAGGGAA